MIRLLEALPRGIQETETGIIGKGVGILVYVIKIRSVLGGGTDVEHEQSITTRNGEFTFVDNPAGIVIFDRIHYTAVMIRFDERRRWERLECGKAKRYCSQE